MQALSLPSLRKRLKPPLHVFVVGPLGPFLLSPPKKRSGLKPPLRAFPHPHVVGPLALPPLRRGLCKAPVVLATFGRAGPAEPRRGGARRSPALARGLRGGLEVFSPMFLVLRPRPRPFALDKARRESFFSGVFLSPEIPLQWVYLAISENRRISVYPTTKKELYLQ